MHHPNTHTLYRFVLAIAAVLGARVGDAQGFAGRVGGHVSRIDVEPHVVFGYGFNRGPGDYGAGFGLGVRVGVPIMPNGLVRTINNSLVVSLGVDLNYWTGGRNGRTFWATSEIIIPAMFQWNFYLTPSFSIFPEIGAAVGVGGCDGCVFFVAPGAALGARLHLNGRADYPAIVLRVGFPVGLSLGLAL